MKPFLQWLNEDASHPGYRLGMYPPGYGGQGLYPPSYYIAGAADAITYTAPNDLKFRFIDFVQLKEFE